MKRHHKSTPPPADPFARSDQDKGPLNRQQVRQAMQIVDAGRGGYVDRDALSRAIKQENGQ